MGGAKKTGWQAPRASWREIKKKIAQRRKGRVAGWVTNAPLPDLVPPAGTTQPGHKSGSKTKEGGDQTANHE